jgi:hypothetical protein
MTSAGAPPSDSNIVADENIRAIARIQQQAAQRRTLAQRVSDHVSSLRLASRGSHGNFAWCTIWIVAELLLAPQRVHGIDSAGAHGGDGARRDGHRSE